MKVEFRFNGEHQLFLIPENGKDKQLLQLMFAERPIVRVKPNKDPEIFVIEAYCVSDNGSQGFIDNLRWAPEEEARK